MCRCDVSGQAYPGTVALEWGNRVVQEFKDEAARRAAEALPVPAFMEDLDDPLQFNKLQLGFIENITLPLWNAVEELIPGLEVRMLSRAGVPWFHTAAQDPINNMQANRLHWEGEVRRLLAMRSNKPPQASHSSGPQSADSTVEIMTDAHTFRDSEL